MPGEEKKEKPAEEQKEAPTAPPKLPVTGQPPKKTPPWAVPLAVFLTLLAILIIIKYEKRVKYKKRVKEILETTE